MAKNYKLPYIPDKDLYFAVIGACSYVKNTGYFNKACNYYADKYDVNVEDVKKYVRIAQGNGQKAANSKAKRKYHWYAVEFSVMNGFDPYFEPSYAQYETRKATSENNAKNAVSKEFFSYGTGSEISYRDAYFGRIKQFDTEKEASACCKSWSTERVKTEEQSRMTRDEIFKALNAIKEVNQ